MTIETLAYGYSLIEGPRVAPDGGLFFSDVHNGGVRRLGPDGSIDVVIPKRRGVGGIALHADGGIVVSGRNVAHVRDGETRILYERDDVGGFNDLFADGHGRVIVGSLCDDPFKEDGPTRKAGDAYRIDAPGQAVTLYGDVKLSNGIGLSPDGTKLYHVDTPVGILVHDIDEAGNASGGRVFATPEKASCDGLTVDRDGGVWVALIGPGAVGRFNPDGSFDRMVKVPARMVTSLVFAGPAYDQMIAVTADNTDDESRGGTIFRIDADELGGAVGMPPPLVRI